VNVNVVTAITVDLVHLIKLHPQHHTTIDKCVCGLIKCTSFFCHTIINQSTCHYVKQLMQQMLCVIVNYWIYGTCDHLRNHFWLRKYSPELYECLDTTLEVYAIFTPYNHTFNTPGLAFCLDYLKSRMSYGFTTTYYHSTPFFIVAC